MKDLAQNILVWLALFLGFSAGATTLYVNVGNPAPASPFTGWPTAATNIQDAIDASKVGDLIWVTHGV